jgi:hypothetical protein
MKTHIDIGMTNDMKSALASDSAFSLSVSTLTESDDVLGTL